MSELPRTVPPRRPTGNRPTRRQILVRRAVALGTMGVVLAIAAVLVIGGFGKTGGQSSMQGYADAWAAGDTRAMYDQISPESQSAIPYKEFKRKVERARDTATVRNIQITNVEKTDNSTWEISSKIGTRAFGTIDKPLKVSTDGDGDDARIKWNDSLVFPGVPLNASLTRDTRMPARATLETRDGVALAEGDTRNSTLGAAASNATGAIGSIPESAKDRYYALGYPSTAQVGVSGLEKTFEVQLAGKPGGTLRGGAETIASSTPRKGADVKTTIDSEIQQAALNQLGQYTGAIVVIKPQTGEILGYSGAPFTNLQPPGSTFKIITAAAGLENQVVDEDSSFPVVQSEKISGVDFENADRELCGGTLLESFAKSCNSAFGPIGVKVGADKLIAMAEKFGFNKKPSVPGAVPSTMPNVQTLHDDLQVASASIGQSTVQATALQMGTVAATIALRGQRPQLTLDYKRRGRAARTTRVIDPATAATIRRMMVAVVDQGTGEFARIPGVQVAGKTGTAELRASQDCDPTEQQTKTTKTNGETTITEPCPEPTGTDTDSWFVAFAPASNPDIVVCVMLVAAGQGRETAAPAARQVMEVALGKKNLSELTAPAPPPVDPTTTTSTTPTTPTP